MSKKKLLIIGHARHGKDTLAEILRDGWGYTFQSSSYAAAEKVVYPVLQPKYGYTSIEEAYEDRVNHRAEWKELITAYNTPDKTRLAKEIMQENDIYVGMRCKDELSACKAIGLFDHIIWVDAEGRVDPEDESSNTLSMDMADIVVDNSGTGDQLIVGAYNLMCLVNRKC